MRETNVSQKQYFLINSFLGWEWFTIRLPSWPSLPAWPTSERKLLTDEVEEGLEADADVDNGEVAPGEVTKSRKGETEITDPVPDKMVEKLSLVGASTMATTTKETVGGSELNEQHTQATNTSLKTMNSTSNENEAMEAAANLLCDKL